LAKAFGAALFPALFRHAVERHFCLFDLLGWLDIFAHVERAACHIAAHAHQLTQQSKVINLLGKVARAQKCRARPCQLRQIGRAAQRLHGLILLKHRLQSDGVRHH